VPLHPEDQIAHASDRCARPGRSDNKGRGLVFVDVSRKENETQGGRVAPPVARSAARRGGSPEGPSSPHMPMCSAPRSTSARDDKADSAEESESAKASSPILSDVRDALFFVIFLASGLRVWPANAQTFEDAGRRMPLRED